MTTTWPSHFNPEVVSDAYGGGRLSSFCLALEAWRRGLGVTWTRGDLRNYTISDGATAVRFNDSRPQSMTLPEDYRRLVDKWQTKRHLEAAGIPVPEGVFIEDAEMSGEDLDELANEVGFPLVLKPNDGTMGQGVYSNIQDHREFHYLYGHLRKSHPVSSVLIEKQINGDDYRVVVVGDRVVAAVLRIPANVVGDGVETVEQLVKRKNADRSRNPFLSKGLIKVDVEVRSMLESQNLDLSSIPDEGRHVHLRRVANASAGGDVVDVTDDVPEKMRDAAVAAVAAMPNIHVAGVDFLYSSEGANDFAIIEMNSRPHIPVNMYPTAGVGRDVPKAMIDYFFPESRRPETPGTEMLTLDLSAVQSVLAKGHASSVTLAALPPHHFPARLRWELPRTHANPFSQRDTDRLIQIAGSKGVSGRLIESARGEVILIVAGESVRQCRTLLDWILRTFTTLFGGMTIGASDGPEEWVGPIAMGFTVDSGLIRRSSETSLNAQ